MKSDYISWGVGVNSTAIIALHLLGRLPGKPEIVFADTGAELPETYAYFREVKRILEKTGWKITRLDSKTHPDLYTAKAKGKTLYEALWDMKVLPGFGWRWCTKEYKARLLKRYLPGFTPMVGICADEIHRIRQDAVYPLRDYTRCECADLIAEAGLPQAHKTGCWFCMFQSKAGWLKLHDNHPELFKMAVDLENNSDKWKYYENLSLQQQIDKWRLERDLEQRQLLFL